MKRTFSFPMLALLVMGATQVHAVDYPLPPPGSRLIGQNQTYIVPAVSKNLEKVAETFQTGVLLLLEANNTVDPFLPTPGSELTIPTQMLLPDTPREGIVVNLAELRLYYYPPGENRVEVYPIGIGLNGRETPVMSTRIIQKIPNPTWTPTAAMRARSQAQGITLPAVIPAGANNPLGRFALRLQQGGGEYLIHGTNARSSIGLRASSGCIRMRAADIKALFNQVAWGTRVQVINEPVKYASEPDGQRYVEVHQPLSRSDADNPQTMPVVITAAFGQFIDDAGTDAMAVDNALTRRAGYPVAVSAHSAPPAQITPIQSVRATVAPPAGVGLSEAAVQPVAQVTVQ